MNITFHEKLTPFLSGYRTYPLCPFCKSISSLKKNEYAGDIYFITSCIHCISFDNWNILDSNSSLIDRIRFSHSNFTVFINYTNDNIIFDINSKRIVHESIPILDFSSYENTITTLKSILFFQ